MSHRAVAIRGWIVAADRQSQSVFIQDETAAVRAQLSNAGRFPIAGEYGRISGLLASVGPSTTIVDSTFESLPRDPALKQPVPQHANLADLLSGRLQYKLTEVRGVVHEVTLDTVSRASLKVFLNGQSISVPVEGADATKMRALIDADVLLSGAPAVRFDITGRVIDVTLWPVSSGAPRVVVAAPPPDLIPQLSLKDVPKLSSLPDREIRVVGVITQGAAGAAFALGDGIHKLQLRPVLSDELPLGAAVEARGFLVRSGNASVLDAAVINEHGADGTRFSTIRAVSGVRQLKTATAALGLPVDITAVVTFVSPKTRLLFVQDSTGGIYVQPKTTTNLALRAGDRVRVRAQSDPGEFANSLRQADVQFLEPASLPATDRLDFDRIFSGMEDSSWVKLSGIVESVDNTSKLPVLRIRAAKMHFDASFPEGLSLPENLLDSRVVVQGVCGSRFNSVRQFLGVRMYVPGLAFVSIAESGPARPPLVSSIRDLLAYSPRLVIGHRIRARGTVTFSSPEGPTTLQDIGGSLIVLNHKHCLLSPGDVVEATGFAQSGAQSPVFEEAEFSPALGHGSVQPLVASAPEILEKNLNGTLVQLDAQLIDQISTNDGQSLTLEADGITFQAKAQNKTVLDPLEIGSVLRITGVSILVLDSDFNKEAHFGLLISSPHDITVLHPAPWLTLRHTFQVGGSLTLFGLAGALWIVVLRRQVRNQTQIINEKLLHEEELRVQAQAANQSKTEFLANVSHEIRTPMNGVLGMTELALNADLSPDVRDYLRVAYSSAEQLLDLLNDLLDMSKIEAGRLTLENIIFSPQEVAADASKTFANKAHEKSLELIIDVDPAVPDYLHGDPFRLRQVLLNLLSNAIKFTERGEIVLSVAPVTAGPNGCVLKFSVMDTGLGIPANKLDSIFTAFTQADGSTTRKYGGTGLGLTICRQIVRLMNGEIGVQSDAGAGSRFWFTARFETTSDLPGHAVRGNVDQLTGIRVLIVDDNSTNRKIFERASESWGMRPTSVDSANAAIEASQKAMEEDAPFLLFIVDCQMPDQDGFDLVEALQRMNLIGNASVLMLSALNNTHCSKCRELGIQCHLVKPFARKDLLEAVLMSLAKRRSSSPVPSVPAPADSDTENSPLRILLAEDNRVNQIVASRLLQRARHTVTIVETGAEAVKSFTAEPFDVILMDVQMPEMDGYEAARTIRSSAAPTAKTIPIIALTAHATAGDRDRCLAAGMNDFLTKPLNSDLLFAKLNLIAASRGQTLSA